MRYDNSNLKQTVSGSIGMSTVMMFSIGLALLKALRSNFLASHPAQFAGQSIEVRFSVGFWC